MNIPFHKPFFDQEELQQVREAIESGWWTMGPKTIEFEKRFANYIGVPFALSVNSCTAALHLALRVIGLKRSDQVVLPAMTFAATAEVVRYFGATPVIVDVNRHDANLSIEKLEEATANKKIRAIIPVHYGGFPCDMEEIMDLATRKKLFVIEDAAHALPAFYKNQRVGTIGDLTCFSFYVTKTLATGEGGMITTFNDEWAQKIKVLRLHGISADAWNRYSDEGSWYYEIVDVGYKYNMTDLNAGLGLAQLNKVDWMWNRRKEIADLYRQAFADLEEIDCFEEQEGKQSAWHLFVIKLNLECLRITRADFIRILNEKGVHTSVHFIPLYRHPYYAKMFSFEPAEFPNSEWLYERVISLPIYPGMSFEAVSYVIETVRDTALKNRK